jgi:uncharacterized membrane protein YcaP (DUF421 family)
MIHREWPPSGGHSPRGFDMTEMVFDGLDGLLRIVAVGISAYVALLVLLLTTGKRTLSKMNAFDFVVTIALGSALSTTILSKSVALAEGVLGLALLVFLQFSVSWLAVRFKGFEALVKSAPTLLVHCGKELNEAMRAERITSDEILAAVRATGQPALDDRTSVVLEADGSLSVMSGSPAAVARA